MAQSTYLKQVLGNPNYCQEFLRNPTINPDTGRKIKIGGPTYLQLVKECGEPSPELLSTTTYSNTYSAESSIDINIPPELLFYESPFENLIPDITVPQPRAPQPSPIRQPARPTILPRSPARTPIQRSTTAPQTTQTGTTAPQTTQRTYLPQNRILPTRQSTATRQVTVTATATPAVTVTATSTATSTAETNITTAGSRQIVSMGQIMPNERELRPISAATPTTQRLPVPPRMASPTRQTSVERAPLRVQTIPTIPQGKITVPTRPRVTAPIMRPTEVVPGGGMSGDTMMEIILRSDIGTINRLCRGNRAFRQICQNDRLWQLLYQRDFANKPFYKLEVKEGTQIKWYQSYIRTFQMLNFFNQFVPQLVTIIEIPYREDRDDSWITADAVYDNMNMDLHDAMTDVVNWARRFNPPNKTYINRLEDLAHSTYAAGSDQETLFTLQDHFNDYLEDVAHGTSDFNKTIDTFVAAGAFMLRA